MATIAADSKRLSAHEIFDKAISNGRDELDRTTQALAISGVAGGITMGLTGLSVSIARHYLGDGQVQELLAMLLYPMGFMAVVIGRAQLFTENTLYPVVLILRDRKQKEIWNTLRLWTTVFVANVVGAFLFALLAMKSGGFRPEFTEQMVKLGTTAVQGSFWTLFWSGVFGGWLIALVAWLVTAGQWTIGQIAVVWALTFVVGAGHFAHCIATSCEILSAVVQGAVPAGWFFHWLAAATLGNIFGGVMIVSLLNYGQVVAGEEEE